MDQKDRITGNIEEQCFGTVLHLFFSPPLIKKEVFVISSLFKNIFIDYAITVVPFPPLYSTPSCTPPPSHIPPPIVHVHGSHLKVLWLLHFPYYSYPLPVYFLPTIYATYSLYVFPLSPPPTPH